MATVDGKVQADFTITITKGGKEIGKFTEGEGLDAIVLKEAGKYVMTIEYNNTGVSVTPTSKYFDVK